MKRKRSKNKEFSSNKELKPSFKTSDKTLSEDKLHKMDINYLSNPESEETGSQNQQNPKLTQAEETGSQNQPNSRQNQQKMERLIDIMIALNQKSKAIIAQTELMKKPSSFDSSAIEDLSAKATDCDEVAKLLAELIQPDM